MVGSAAVKGRLPRVPIAWTSPDGVAWHRQEVPGSDGFTDLERVIRTPEGLLAAGIRGDEFGAWERIDGTWHRLGLFGALDPDRRAGPYVSGLTQFGCPVLRLDQQRDELRAVGLERRPRVAAGPDADQPDHRR